MPPRRPLPPRNAPKSPVREVVEHLSHRQLEDIVVNIATVLYGGEDGWEPDREWDSSTIEEVDAVLPDRLKGAIERAYNTQTGEASHALGHYRSR